MNLTILMKIAGRIKALEDLPSLKSGEQTVLIKEAIVLYFQEQELI